MISNKQQEGSVKARRIKVVLRDLRKSRTATFGLAVVSTVIVMALLAPVIAPYDPKDYKYDEKLQPPSNKHWLGTDNMGRDILSRIFWGARFSLIVGFGASGIAALLGTLVGALAGYFRGIIDFALMRIVETLLVIPSFFLYLLVVAMIRNQSPFVLLSVMGLIMWPRLARIVRSEFLSLREREYVKAARMVGATSRRIILRHILPNAMASIIVVSTLNISTAILMESGLMFLGLGDPTAITWGSMLATGRMYMIPAWWLVTFPGIAIFLTVMSFNMIGDGLRDTLDPRLRGRLGTRI